MLYDSLGRSREHVKELMAESDNTDLGDCSADAEPIEFEAALAELEQIVDALEGGELGLGESLREYERGVGRLKSCHQLLDRAEQQVTLLAGFDAEGNPVREPMADRAQSPARGGRAGSGARPESPSQTGEGGRSSRSGKSSSREDADDSPGLF